MATPTPLTILDGPMGTELLARGVPTPLPGWSAHALDTDPDAVSQIHADYAAAGAAIHTTNTFRTTARLFPDRWRELTALAVECARSALPAEHRLAGSIAPIEDCYRPELSPPDARVQHAPMARALADAGCNLLLCETFPHIGEALAALDAALATGLPSWLSLTPGYKADLLTPAQLAAGGRLAARAGAAAVLVNCVPTDRALEYLTALRDAVPESTAIGVYANAGAAEATHGWQAARIEPEAYADLAEIWAEAGATILGSCCGTGVPHIRALAVRFTPPGPRPTLAGSEPPGGVP